MANCHSCGAPINDGYETCSMCSGEIFKGSDNYYEEWAREQERESQREEERQDQEEPCHLTR